MGRNWLKYQNKPSFKGIPFEVDTDSVTGERSIIVHEYPNSEFWDEEDLGRKVFSIDVSGYVCGTNAYEKAQALLAASTSNTGPGLLVLPSRVPTTARCKRCKSTWEADKQGRISVELEFIASSRVPGGLVPSADVGMGNTGDESTKELISQFSEDFNSRFRSFSAPVGVPSVAREAAGVTIGLAGDALFRAFSQTFISDPVASAQVEFGIRQVRFQALQYAEQGTSAYRIDEQVFVDDQDDTVSAFSRVFTDTLRLMQRKAVDQAVVAGALMPLLTFQPQTLNNVDTRVLTVRAELVLTGSVADFVRRTCLIRWAEAMTRAPYTSRADAVNAKGQLTDAFNAELDPLDDPDIAEPLREVQRAAVSFLVRNGAQLPRTVKLPNAAGLPAAVVAGQLYADLLHDQDQDLWLRNGIEYHPLALPQKVEALTP